LPDAWEIGRFERLLRQGDSKRTTIDAATDTRLMPAEPRLLARDASGSGLYFVRVTGPSRPPAPRMVVTDGPYRQLAEAIGEARRALTAFDNGEVAILMGCGQTASVLVRGDEIRELAARLQAP
jgi:hypothetical protein